MKLGNVVFFCENEIEKNVVLEVLKANSLGQDRAIEETSKEEYCITLYKFIEPWELQKIKMEVKDRLEDIRDARRVKAIHAIHEIIENYDLGIQVEEHLYEAIYEIQRMRDEK